MKKIASVTSILIVGLSSVMMFAWPLFIASSSTNEATVAQTVFIILMPLTLLLLLVEFSSGDLGAKHLALLGVLTALNAVIRMLGAGTAGIETAFFLVILSAFVFGSGFGFLLGASSMFVSALLTGGFGPWLPFQMMGIGLVGLAAGILPHFKNKWLHRVTLVLFSVLASFIYGSLLTLWNWPYLAGLGTQLSYVPGASITLNLTRFFQYELVTGGFIWDLGRAITTSVLVLLTSSALIATLNRAATRAGVLTRS